MISGDLQVQQCKWPVCRLVWQTGVVEVWLSLTKYWLPLKRMSACSPIFKISRNTVIALLKKAKSLLDLAATVLSAQKLTFSNSMNAERLWAIKPRFNELAVPISKHLPDCRFFHRLQE